MTTASTYIFPCDTVNGLTLTQKRAAIAALKTSIKEEMALRRTLKAEAKAEKAEKAESLSSCIIATLQFGQVL